MRKQSGKVQEQLIGFCRTRDQNYSFASCKLKFYAIDISNLYGYFFLFLVQSQDRYLRPQKNVQAPVRVKPLCLQFHSLERQRIITHSSRVKCASVICAAALPATNQLSVFLELQSATCASEQTQTVTRQSSTITVAPIQGEFFFYALGFDVACKL
ncbi:hypothetical protein SASPL_132818 [Salvia splendens]|uniref:Uncharacterized protein n=1 Tax=Salvia splendens TaxID=180675 RepID=A0A8X8X2N3_SALSN|nr:hypothetical protein SASPL_132818 [Salvia splendens]